MQVRILTFRAMTALVFATGPCLQAIAAQAPGSGAQPPKPVVMGDPLRRDLGVPDSSPNISGTWSPNTFFRVISPVDGSATPFLPWAREFFLNRNAAEARGEPLFDPNANCLPSGVPRVIPTPYPLDIVQTPDAIYIGIEVMHSFRIIRFQAHLPGLLGGPMGRRRAGRGNHRPQRLHAGGRGRPPQEQFNESHGALHEARTGPAGNHLHTG